MDDGKNGCADDSTEKQPCTNTHIKKDERTDGQIYGQIVRLMERMPDEWTVIKLTDGQTDARIDGRTYGRTD